MSTTEAPSKWERALPVSGVAFTALMVLGAVAFPMPPGGDVSPASKPGWLAAHSGAVIAQSYIRGLAALAFVVLAVAVAGVCRRGLDSRSPLPTVALLGGLVCGVLVLLAQAMTLAAALLVRGGVGADSVRALGVVQDAFLDLSALPAVLLFASFGIAALRISVLPRWLAVLSLVGVPLALVDAASYDGGPLEGVALVGLVYFLAWALITGAQLSFAHPRADSPVVSRQAVAAL